MTFLVDNPWQGLSRAAFALKGSDFQSRSAAYGAE